MPCMAARSSEYCKVPLSLACGSAQLHPTSRHDGAKASASAAATCPSRPARLVLPSPAQVARPLHMSQSGLCEANRVRHAASAVTNAHRGAKGTNRGCGDSLLRPSLNLEATIMYLCFCKLSECLER